MGKLIRYAALALVLALTSGLGLLASGCLAPSYSGEGAYEPPPNAVALLSEAADNLRALRSSNLSLRTIGAASTTPMGRASMSRQRTSPGNGAPAPGPVWTLIPIWYEITKCRPNREPTPAYG